MIKKIFKNKKNIIIISILGIILVIGTTYALINWTSNNYNVAIKSSCMNINYTKGQNIDKNLGVIDESQYISGNTITMNTAMAFSSVDIELLDTCDIDGLANVEINVTSLSNELTIGGKYYGALKYVVVEYDPSDYTNLTMSELEDETFNIVSRGIISNTGTIDAHTVYIAHGNEKNYLIIFYANGTILNNDLVDLSFDGDIGARVEQFVPTPISDFTYTLTNGNVRITKYNGSATKVNLAPTYTINGVVYNTVVYGSVFKNKTTIQEVIFADNITADSGYAYEMFSGCTNLKKVTGLPNNITTVTNTFYGCTSLITAPEISNSVTSMFKTFYGCTSLITAPTIPNSVTSMERTFQGCTSLINAPEIPNSVTSMPYTFYGCTSLITAPTLGNSVKDMIHAFEGCTSLVNAPVIPNSVTNMASTFNGCTSLVNAPAIPDSVTNLNSTFSQCSSLVSVPSLSNSVTTMYSTFNGCTSLVNAPTIPSSVIDMTSTFRGCNSLTGTIRINSSSVTRASGSTNHPFYNTSKTITVEVPQGSTTYTTINNNKPINVIISTFTS